MHNFTKAAIVYVDFTYIDSERKWDGKRDRKRVERDMER